MLRKFKYLFRWLVQLDGSPHSIALGGAIGFFVAWTPTIGLHMILVVAICRLLRANYLAGLIAVYISNPLTFLPMLWFTYELGALISDRSVSREEFVAIVEFDSFATWLVALKRLCIDLAAPMWIGGLILACVNAVPSYFLIRRKIEQFRQVHDRGESSSESVSTPPVSH